MRRDQPKRMEHVLQAPDGWRLNVLDLCQGSDAKAVIIVGHAHMEMLTDPNSEPLWQYVAKWVLAAVSEAGSATSIPPAHGVGRHSVGAS